MAKHNKKLRTAVIGTGYLGKFHAEKYAGMDNVDLVGIVDVNETACQELASRLGTTAYTDYRELFGNVDAVSIVVPTPLHHKVGMDFLENNTDILIEKPMTVTLAQADELIELAETNGLIIQVGHLERYNSAVIPLANIVKNPRFIESHRLSIFQERGTDVSVVLDLMIHDIDIILNFVKSEIKDIRAAGIAVISEHIDIANARLEFKNGCVANVTASRVSLKNERKIRLFQKDAYVAVDFAEHNINIIRQGKPEAQGLIPGAEIETLSFENGDALKDEIKAFVESVTNRVVPEVSGPVGRNALNIALIIMEQIKTTSRLYRSST